jgi:hypothetical protein
MCRQKRAEAARDGGSLCTLDTVAPVFWLLPLLTPMRRLLFAVAGALPVAGRTRFRLKPQRRLGLTALATEHFASIGNPAAKVDALSPPADEVVPGGTAHRMRRFVNGVVALTLPG